MALFTWKDEYSVKVEKIDQQHKRLVELLNELHSSMLAAKATGILDKILTELVEYAAVHFKTEEDLFKIYDYVNYAAHKEAHDSFTKKVKEFYDDFKLGKKSNSISISGEPNIITCNVFNRNRKWNSNCNTNSVNHSK